MRVLQIDNPKELIQIMREIKVDPYGIKIMSSKAITHLVRINSISNICANILKQEMLSLGGDVAVARDALTGRTKRTDCLLMGNLLQISRLNAKLNKQPFGLDKLGKELSKGLIDYRKNEFILDLGRYRLNLGKRTYIMGIVNLTSDSFSGDGLYKIQNPKTNGSTTPVRLTSFAQDCPELYRRTERSRSTKIQNYIIDYVEKLAKDGADIIDLGGASSRPGAKTISTKEELLRVIPSIKLLVKRINLPLSIDTYNPEVARQALDNGVSLINDITGLRNPKMIKVVAKFKAAVVIMHMKGTPRTMQKNPKYSSLIDEIIEYLDKAVNLALSYEIDRDKIIIDPGIGFGKTLEHNLQIIKRLREFRILGQPILVGPSRKSFIGKILNLQPPERIFGTVATCVLAAEHGANIIRVHDCLAVKQALKITDAITNI